jgi:hypothetical protein
VNQVGDDRYVSFIGPKSGSTWEAPSNNDYLIMVTGDTICFDETPSANEPWLVGGGDSDTYLGLDPPMGWTYLQIWRGEFRGDNDGLLRQNFKGYVNLPLNSKDDNEAIVTIDVARRRAEGVAPLTRSIAGVPQPLDFTLSWDVGVDGYKQPAQGGSFNFSVTRDGPAVIIDDIASLSLRLNNDWKMVFDSSSQRFTNLYNTNARIFQPSTLGGANKPIQAMIGPDNYLPQPPPADSQFSCTLNCLDLRNADDINNRTWDLPDITVAELPTTTTQGATPANDAQTVANIPFSFRSFGGEVRVSRGSCPGSASSDSVDIIEGTTALALPGMGSDLDPAAMIQADFTLCQSALRQASLSFKSSQGIPIPPTPIFVDGIKGDITIGPGSTKVGIYIDYYIGDPWLVNSDDGASFVEIDTAGRFYMTTSGAILSQAGYTGWAQVAWNPLDVEVEARVFFPNGLWWVAGEVRAHVWKGAGWQGKYPHLAADPDKTHFTARGEVAVRIPEGALLDKWFIELPPVTIPIGGFAAEVGEFCTNGDCDEYEWGVEGVYNLDVGAFFGVPGIGVIKVGAYYSPTSGNFAIILGSDGKILIDQYGTQSAAQLAAELEEGVLRYAVDPQAKSVTQPFTVTANTASFITGLSWGNGNPQLTLTRPDGQQITPANAESLGLVSFSSGDGPFARLYTALDPMPGVWQATISNATPNDDYHFVYSANRDIPTLSGLSPATDVTVTSSGGDSARQVISWTAPSNAEDLRVSLYYSTTNPLTSTVMSGVIIEDLPAVQGGYSWDMGFLAAGEYQLFATLSDGAQRIRPDAPGAQRTPGSSTTLAAGKITLVDTTAPVPPDGLELTPLDDALRACWNVSAAKDLAGYVLVYQRPGPLGLPVLRRLRVPATVPFAQSQSAPPRQCARIGGLNDGIEVKVSVASYDASGNLSAEGPQTSATVTEGAPDQAPPTGLLSGSVGTDLRVSLNWSTNKPLTEGGFRVYYAAGYSTGPGQQGSGAAEGDAPFVVGKTPAATVSGLEPGLLYSFAVQSFDDEGRLGPLSNQLRLLVSNGVDSDKDGMADDWEQAYGVSDANGDADGDGLNNKAEFDAHTIPTLADTDRDGLSDGTEVNCGSDPLDRDSLCDTLQSLPPALLVPRLVIDQRRLNFVGYSAGPAIPAKAITISNGGGGTLTTNARADVDWLKLTTTRDGIQVSVIHRGLAAGSYSAMITIGGDPGTYTQDSPQTVTVRLSLFRGAAPDGESRNRTLYLPIIQH